MPDFISCAACRGRNTSEMLKKVRSSAIRIYPERIKFFLGKQETYYSAFAAASASAAAAVLSASALAFFSALRF